MVMGSSHLLRAPALTNLHDDRPRRIVGSGLRHWRELALFLAFETERRSQVQVRDNDYAACLPPAHAPREEAPTAVIGSTNMSMPVPPKLCGTTSVRRRAPRMPPLHVLSHASSAARHDPPMPSKPAKPGGIPSLQPRVGLDAGGGHGLVLHRQLQATRLRVKSAQAMPREDDSGAEECDPARMRVQSVPLELVAQILSGAVLSASLPERSSKQCSLPTVILPNVLGLADSPDEVQQACIPRLPSVLVFKSSWAHAYL
ncbi:hypothetical protein HMN09_01399700 [Mycena chlorophos]|uniref:Uncharacterized protein n=1 Tax=Mycena chlorophos TaxID=658473 RepID=A0A8H6RX93_MYCCL|nr:hypothetical protein HMN09_01399700 [Mycena chlorophos]